MTFQHDEKVTGRILIVDDDDLFRESIARNLSNAGFAPIAFADGASVLRHLSESSQPDVILLDWKMPGMTGIELLAELRKTGITTPVIFLTVLGDQIYEEAGLHGGAVDFIEKSRGFSIVSHRIGLILRAHQRIRIAPPRKTEVLTQGHLELRRDLKSARWKNIDVDLTATEFLIVNHLVSHVGRDVGYRELYDLVHGDGFLAGSGDHGYRVNVRTFIKRIRHKFRKIDPEFAQIENYPGFGYRWSDATHPTASSEDGGTG